MKCEKCGSENIIHGWLNQAGSGISFGENVGKLSLTMKNQSLVIASACKSCGHIFDLKLKNPERLERTK